jgi:AraC-like DNA-binding protein
VLTASPDLAASSEELLFSLLPRAFAGEREGLPIPSSPRLESAERHIEQRLFDEDLTIDDVAAASGMGQRTLYRLFRQVHGKGPMAWARDRRLDLARQCLLEAGAPLRGVTGIALDHGFDHFGRFAAFYRMRFGELPSDTLRRGRLM